VGGYVVEALARSGIGALELVDHDTVSITNLNIRTGPGTNYPRTGSFTGAGQFEIVETATGDGSRSGWGKLKSGEGWISLDYVIKI
jgi:uncharacterized protein YraI